MSLVRQHVFLAVIFRSISCHIGPQYTVSLSYQGVSAKRDVMQCVSRADSRFASGQ